MANRLKMALVDTIQRLLQQGWSYRRIARELGIHRDTVGRLAGKSKPAKAPLGSGALIEVVAAVDAQATQRLSVVSSSAASCLHSSEEKGPSSGAASCPNASEEKGHVDGRAESEAVDSRSACEPYR